MKPGHLKEWGSGEGWARQCILDLRAEEGGGDG